MKLLTALLLLISFNTYSQLTATISGTDTVCVGSSAGLGITFSGLNGTQPYTFFYNINGGATQSISTAGGNSVSISPSTGTAGAFSYNLISVQDAMMSMQNVADTATFTVESIPTVNAGGDQFVCMGNQVVLNGSGASTYTWDNGVINGVPFVTLNTTTYTVTGTSVAGCTNTDQVMVTVFPFPPVNAGPDQTICQGTSITLIASGATTYSWSPATGLSTTTGASVIATPTTTTTYTLVGVSQMGCANTDQVTITVVPSFVDPGATIDSAYCNNGAISIIQSSATTNYSYAWSNGSTTSFINNLSAGVYSVAINDFTTGCGQTFTYVVPNSAIPSNCAQISGSVYFDNDENCLINTGDDLVPNRMIVANPGNYLAVTDANGLYSFQLPLGTYTVQEIFVNPSYGNYCNLSYTVPLVNPTDSIGNNNFLDTITGDIDLQAYLYNTPVMPGFNFCLYPSYYNLTSAGTLLNAEAWIKIPAGVTMLNWVYPHTVSNDTIYFTLNTPQSFSSQMCFIASGVSLGMPVTFCTGVEIQSGEQITANNTYCQTSIVIGSYDPNDKTMFLNGVQSDSTIYETDETLDYVIRFQNTGTAPAQNIYILDTIQSTLDLSTFEFRASSHPCNVSILEGNVLKFNFPMIMLPDSTNNEPESHGFVSYRIKQSASNTLGTVINNTAYIYFDFNEPVVTNTTFDEIVIDDLGLMENNQINVKLYPNPTSGLLNISSDGIIEEVKLFQANGQQIMTVNFDNQNSTIDLGSISEGIYFIEITTQNNRTIKRILKN